ncbi:VUT family protein [Tumebacillus lipolyticus]|uniref:VUT family protein n=1 Tax=Tumebacillus lipolyticus TaxID=1280370 RepID=A0ABW4ZSZ0_9BACL
MFLVVLYLAAIVAANLSVAFFGPASTILNAFLFIGLDITTRDALHERWQGKRLWINMALLVLTGSVISYLLNREAGQVALASFVAFALSGVADTIIYHLMRRYPKWKKVNGSNIVSSAVDSITFPTIAFGTFIPWVVAGQFLAKVFGGYVWSLILNRFVWKETRVKG